MSRYIDAEKIEYKTVAYPVFDFSTGMVYTKCLEGEYARQEDIESLPKADVREVKRGKWFRTVPTTTKSYRRICSLCGKIAYMIRARYTYCPWCGAKMDGGESE